MQILFDWTRPNINVSAVRTVSVQHVEHPTGHVDPKFTVVNDVRSVWSKHGFSETAGWYQ